MDDDPLNPPDQTPDGGVPANNAIESDDTTTVTRRQTTDELDGTADTATSSSTTAIPARETQTSTRSTATTISTRRTSTLEEDATSTSDTRTEDTSSTTTESTSTTERPTTTRLPSSSETETSNTPSTMFSSTIEPTTISTETTSRIEERPKSREIKPSRPSLDPSPTRLPSKGDAKDDGLGTGTIIGIALAGFVGAGLIVIIIGALLRWRRKRIIAKKSEGLPAFKTILDFADTAGDKDSIEHANRRAAEDLPVTPPYRPEMRQPLKRQSWYDEHQMSEHRDGDDYTFQPTNVQPPTAGISLARANTRQHRHGDHHAQTMDDRLVDHGMAEYADYGLARPPPQLIPGKYGSQQAGGAFDPMRGQNGYGQYPQPDARDACNDRRNGPVVRNRHFPTAPGRSYTSDNPYPFVPTAHNR